MSTVPSPSALESLDGKLCQLSVQFSLPSRTVAMAEPLHSQTVLGEAALSLAELEPNKGVALLLGAALEASCRGDGDQVELAMGAVVHLLKGITETQALGVAG